MDIRMKMFLLFLVLMSVGVCYGQGQPSTDATTQTLSNKTITSAANTLTIDCNVSTCQNFPGGGSAGNPTGTIGLSTVNGSAATYMRSDASPPLSQSITPLWTGLHKYTLGDFALLGSSTGYTLLESGLSGAGNNTLLLPTTASDTVAALGTAETWTALQTFGTNISIGGVTVAGATGTGNNVFSISPTLTTPALGTPSAINLTNATNLPAAQLTGNVSVTSTTGAWPIANGGTGQTTANAALNALLPSQSGVTSGWSLQTNGTNAAWAAGGGGGCTFAAPTALIGATATTGSSGNCMDAGSAPAINETIAFAAANNITQSYNTSADGLTLIDSTAAASGHQQYSPRIRLTGQGWKTTATAASEQVDGIIELQPVTGSSVPLGNLAFSVQSNGGGYISLGTWGTNSLGGSLLSVNQLTASSFVQANYVNVTSSAVVATNGIYLPAASTLGFSTNSTLRQQINSAGHIAFFGTVPAVSACGTSPAIDAHATDRAGTVTVGTVSAASCTVTFATAFTTWNHCRVTSQTTEAAFAYSYSLTAITVTGTSLVGDLFDYECDGS